MFGVGCSRSMCAVELGFETIQILSDIRAPTCNQRWDIIQGSHLLENREKSENSVEKSGDCFNFDPNQGTYTN